MKFGDSGDYLIRLDSTAMSDIIFNLLIFFLLSSSFILDQGIDLELPRAVQPSSLAAREVVVTLAPGEALFINDRSVPWNALEGELGRAIEAAQDKVVIVRGDQSAPLGRVVEVMDAARRQGARSLAIAARPEESRERRQGR